MIKKGDKIIAIKERFQDDDYGYISYKSFLTKGKMYEIEDVYVYVETFWVITDDALRVFNIENFSKYFITLAEWREEQINSILND